MSDADLLLGLQRDFVEETRLELDSWEANLLEFESSGSLEAFSDFKRQIHSMKGSAGAIGLEDLNRVLHDFESWLESASIAGESDRRSVVSVPLSFVDGMRTWVADGTPVARRW